MLLNEQMWSCNFSIGKPQFLWCSLDSLNCDHGKLGTAYWLKCKAVASSFEVVWLVGIVNPTLKHSSSNVLSTRVILIITVAEISHIRSAALLSTGLGSSLIIFTCMAIDRLHMCSPENNKNWSGRNRTSRTVCYRHEMCSPPILVMNLEVTFHFCTSCWWRLLQSSWNVWFLRNHFD